MKIDFLNELGNNLKENEFVQNFINELGEFLQEKLSTNVLDKGENSILESIQNQRNTSIISKNIMQNNMDEILSEYSKNTLMQGDMYFVVSKGKSNDSFTTFKYENGDRSVIQLNKDELPKDARINSVLRKENGKFTLDSVGTKSIVDKIKNMANDVLDKQDRELKAFRKEGHLYKVEEDRNNRIYLTDITDKNSNLVLEEVDFPRDLLNDAKEGAVFKFENGQYHLEN